MKRPRDADYREPEAIRRAVVGGSTAGAARSPAVAGQFYPGEAVACRDAAVALTTRSEPAITIGSSWIGGIVPHAGWMCSGAIAGETLATIAASRGQDRFARHGPAGVDPPLVVVFGAVHSNRELRLAALDSFARWLTPGAAAGERAGNEVSCEARQKLVVDRARLFEVDDAFHTREHAIEVELPLIDALWPGVAILPVEVPAIEDAPRIGAETASCLRTLGVEQAVYLASSDLTHYGPAYDFAPAGVGEQGLAWAKDNDRRLLDRIVRFRVDGVDGIVPAVRVERNACGAGAIAAMLAACRECGATRATVLRHLNSRDVLGGRDSFERDNAVGYAAVVVG